MYINEKNKQFNQKLVWFYNKYMVEIWDSFERGIMVQFGLFWSCNIKEKKYWMSDMEFNYDVGYFIYFIIIGYVVSVCLFVVK